MAISLVSAGVLWRAQRLALGSEMCTGYLCLDHDVLGGQQL